MLTVMREATEVANKNAATFESIEDFFSCFIKEAHASLDRTPELLPVLKEETLFITLFNFVSISLTKG